MSKTVGMHKNAPVYGVNRFPKRNMQGCDFKGLCKYPVLLIHRNEKTMDESSGDVDENPRP